MSRLIIIMLIVLPIVSWGQTDWESPKGAIKDEEVVIEKNKQLTLPVISRRFESINIELAPPDTTAVVPVPENLKFSLPKIPVKLRPKTMKSERLQKTYWGTFKAGYGSYISPYLQADMATKRNDEYAVAMHFKHYSSQNGPIDKSNSGLSNTDAFLSGKLFLNKLTLGANAGGSLNLYHLYGYGSGPIPESNDIKQRLNNFSLAFDISDNDKNEDFGYLVKAGADFFTAKDLNWKETDLYVSLVSNYKLSDEIGIKVLGDLHTSSQKKSTILLDTKRLLYKVKPIVSYKMKPFVFEVGAGFYGTKDSINSFQHKFYITPHVVARYQLESGHTFSAGVGGEVKWQSARTRFNENFYLGLSTIVNNSVKPIDFFLGARGKIIPKLEYTLGYHIDLYRQLGLFVNNSTNPSTFSILYETENNVVHTFSMGLNYVSRKNLQFLLHGNYFNYQLKTQPYAWHKPTFDAGLKILFSLEDKLETSVQFRYLTGIQALEPATLESVELNSILDLNLSVNYRINSMVSVFVNMQNIIGNKYQYYYHYPTKGFQVLAGIRLTF